MADHDELFKEFAEGSDEREVSTTMVFVRMLRPNVEGSGNWETCCADCAGRSAHVWYGIAFQASGNLFARGQLYEPVDVNTLLYYKEAKNGQILEEGITEAGSMSSFIAAGTAYANYGINTIPFFIYYSMFGFQRIGGSDLGRGGYALPRIFAWRNFRTHHSGR